MSKAALYDAVYGMAEDQPFDKVIDVYICKIRKKIDLAAGPGHRYIETVHGRGYKLSPPDRSADLIDELDGLSHDVPTLSDGADVLARNGRLHEVQE